MHPDKPVSQVQYIHYELNGWTRYRIDGKDSDKVAVPTGEAGTRGPTDKTPRNDKFDPNRLGVDHIALACTDERELERVATALADAGIENTGAKMDETLGKNYVAFKDPDRIAWEFYMA